MHCKMNDLEEFVYNKKNLNQYLPDAEIVWYINLVVNVLQL